MQENAGTLFLNGVVQIVTSHVGNNSIPQSDVPDFMRNVSRALVECMITANQTLSGQPAEARAELPASQPQAAIAAPQQTALAAPAATAPAQEAQVQAPAATAQRSRTSPAAEKRPARAVAAPAAPKAAAPKPTAAKTAAAKTAPAQAPAPVAPPEPAPAPDARTKFADLPSKPAVPVGQSVKHDGIICLFDGQSRKMLSRHIKAKYGMTPEEYREFWNLPTEYPMTAPGYSDEKRIVAVAQGLGTQKLYEGVNARKAEAEKEAAAAKAKAPRKSRAKQAA